ANRLSCRFVGPTAEILSFVWPKESIQRKSHPDAAYFLRAGGGENHPGIKSRLVCKSGSLDV
ncbi:hypothetical protein, partial [Methylomonas fluvii]